MGTSAKGISARVPSSLEADGVLMMEPRLRCCVAPAIVDNRWSRLKGRVGKGLFMSESGRYRQVGGSNATANLKQTVTESFVAAYCASQGEDGLAGPGACRRNFK
jgi:hypothetical protein